MADNTRDIRRRIRSVRNTQQITKAMKMVAASKLRKAQSRLLAVRPYEEAIVGRLAALLPQLQGDESPLLARRAGPRLALILVTGDKGLCGAFNNNLIRSAEQFIAEHPGRQITLTAIGKKGARHFAATPCAPRWSYTGLAENATLTQAAAIMHRHVAEYLAGGFDELHLIFSYFRSIIAHQLRTERLLPFEVPDVEQLAARGPQPDYLMMPGVKEVCSYLLEESLNIRLFRALLESASSEFGARMSGMDGATKNAEEMIDQLTLDLNRARQAIITKELAEIVGGAEALSK